VFRYKVVIIKKFRARSSPQRGYAHFSALRWFGYGIFLDLIVPELGEMICKASGVGVRTIPGPKIRTWGTRNINLESRIVFRNYEGICRRSVMTANDPLLYEQNVAIIVRKSEEALSTILDCPGTILYSSYETLRPGKYYFLGLNPGGSASGTDTIKQSLDTLGTRTKNAYFDEIWSSDSRSYGAGSHPLQKRFRYLFVELLKEDAKSVCALNLIFSRSISEKGAGGTKRAELCWQVHKEILNIVQPTAIITFGRLPFDFVLKKLGGTTVEVYPTGHGNWTWRYALLKTGQKLVGLPHLSRYALDSDPSVGKQLAQVLKISI
jgi:hypothetical protein